MLQAEINQGRLKGGARIPQLLLRRLLRVVVRNLKLKEDWLVSIAFVDTRTIRRLNRDYRGQDQPTDVLSFVHRKDGLLGEILICYDLAKRQAQKKRSSVRAEVLFLITHGLLHLLGFDHKNKVAAKVMAEQQEAIQKALRF